MISRELQSQLGTIAIVSGGVAGALVLIDWSLSRSTREWIADKAIRIWYWLSYQRTWPYVRSLQNPRAFDVFFGSCALLILGSLLIYPYLSFGRSISTGQWLLILAFNAIPIGLYVVSRRLWRKLFGWVTSGEAAWKYLLRGFVAYMLVFLAMYALIGPIVLFANRNLELFNEWRILTFPIFFLAYCMVYFAMFIAFALWILVMYIVIIYCLIAIFKIFEFIALRLAEYEKGPILAIAAVLTALGSVMKALAG